MRKDKGKPKKDLSGMKFNLLTVIEFAGVRKQGMGVVSFYRCQCDCGLIKEVKGTHLTRGDTKSCGCLNHRKVPNNGAKANAKFLSYKTHAKKRNLEWDLSFPCFDSLIRMKCFYCKAMPPMFNGIDRMDNRAGYTIENAVPCCSMCNSMKSDYTLEQFLDKIKDIYEQQNFG